MVHLNIKYGESQYNANWWTFSLVNWVILSVYLYYNLYHVV